MIPIYNDDRFFFVYYNFTMHLNAFCIETFPISGCSFDCIDPINRQPIGLYFVLFVCMLHSSNFFLYLIKYDSKAFPQNKTKTSWSNSWNGEFLFMFKYWTDSFKARAFICSFEIKNSFFYFWHKKRWKFDK